MATGTGPTVYRFSFGPWNISTGADPFGPPARKEVEYGRKLKAYKELGFDAVQFHDDDIVPDGQDWAAQQKGIAAVKTSVTAAALLKRPVLTWPKRFAAKQPTATAQVVT